MAKFCANGHQMEDSWEICPYCQKTGCEGVATAKTRIETQAPREAAVARKTVLISEKRKPPVVGWLVAINGGQKGEDFRIREEQNVLGSSPDSDVVLNDSTVSAKHASLRYKDGKFLLTDLDSTNGTYLNDNPNPIAREEIKDNDLIRLGEVTLKFKCL